MERVGVSGTRSGQCAKVAGYCELANVAEDSVRTGSVLWNQDGGGTGGSLATYEVPDGIQDSWFS